MQVRLTEREPRITEPEPDAPDNLTQREPKSAMIASPAADNLKPLHLSARRRAIAQSVGRKGAEGFRVAFGHLIRG